VAIVAGDQGGVSSIVNHNVTGTLVDAHNAQAMSVTIDELLTDSTRLKVMQQAAKHYVTLHHSIEASTRQLNLVVQDAIANKQESL